MFLRDMNNNICMNIMQHNSRRGALQGTAAPERKYRNVFAGRLLMLLMLLMLFGWSNGVMAQTKKVHWVVVALDKSRALTIKNQTVTVGANVIDAFPAKYKSPLLQDADYSFYTSFSGAQTQAVAQKITTIPATLPSASKDTIYVVYKYGAEQKAHAESLGFKSGYGYNLRRVGANTNNSETYYMVQCDYWDKMDNKTNNIYTYPNGDDPKNQIVDQETAYITADTKERLYTNVPDKEKTSKFVWRLNMEDPYQMTIQTLRTDAKHNYYNWYLSGSKADVNGLLNLRVVKDLATAKSRKLWSFAILPGDAAGAYKFVVANNRVHTANANGTDANGHCYINNLRSARKDAVLYINRDAGNTSIANYSDFAINLRPAFRFILKTHVTGTNQYAVVCKDENEYSSSLEIPRELKRKYCTYKFYTYYDEETDEFSNEVTTYQQVVNNGITDIYVKYEVNGMPFEISENYQDAVWYRLYENNSDKYIYSNGGKLQKGVDNTYTNTYFFAFMGDPYELRVINMERGKDRYLSMDDSGDDTGFNNKVPEVNTKKKGYWELYDDGFTDDAQHKYFALRLANTVETYPVTSNDNQLQVSTTKTVAKFEVAPGKKFKYIFKILDKKRRIAMQYETQMAMVTPLNYERIPEAIRSEYISDETINFYSSMTASATTDADGRVIYNAPDNKKKTTVAPVPSDLNNTEQTIEIWVTYTTNRLAEKDLHLRGVRAFSMRVGSDKDGYNYAYADNSTTLMKNATDAPTDNMFWWHVIGDDPYAVQVENVGATTNKYLNIEVTQNNSTTPPTVSVDQNMGKNTALTSSIILMGSSEADDEDKTITMRVLPVREESVIYNDITGQNLHPASIKLVSRKKDVTYCLIDRKGKLLLKSGPVSSDEPIIPDDIRSPFLDDNQYHYYDAAQVTYNTTTETYTHGNTELISATDATGNIYIFYDQCTKLTFSSGPNEGRDQMYLLKYHNGVDFVQEDSKDGFDPSATKPVYPYNNGEANLYIYSQERFDLQMGQGASSRARWGWYVESADHDPYRVKISSHQNQTATNSINHHSYLRSYIPRGYEYIVTGVITNNPKATAESDADWNTKTYGTAPTSFVGGSHDNVPTEYMLLGESMDACKLVTTFLIDGTEKTYGTAEADYDVANHYTVHSFEQYWKNNPTVLNLVYDFNGATTTAEKTAIQTRLNASGLTSAEKLMLRNRGWHSYNAWANINSWSSTSGKTYQYTDHWFQTVEMGETFDFVQFSIAPAVVLIDQHGWEIMRCQQGDKESLKKFNSPMVKAYHWWSESSKQPGYHKYTVSGTTVPLYQVNNKGKFDATGKTYTLPATTRLEDVPYDNLTTSQGYGTSSDVYTYATGKTVKGSNDRRVDLYVTYEVKDEYRDSYIGAANEGGTSASEFLIRQGRNYAFAASMDEINTSTVPGEKLSEGRATEIDNDMKWYLKPNFNIDREMGYKYKGEDGAQEKAKTKEETEEDNYTSTDNGVADLVNGRNGFDPYNLQVQNVKHGTYMTSSLTSTTIDTKGAYKGTYGTENTLKLTNGTETFTVSGHDQVTMRVTNTVFMAVQDDNGNMRLMPRFDQYNVIENFGRDAEDGTAAATTTIEVDEQSKTITSAIVTPAVAQPANDKVHPQTTLLQVPRNYTYVVIDNKKEEALRFESNDGELFPEMKHRFTSPFAKDFKFYHTATLSEGKYTLNEADTITSLVKVSLTDGLIYVRYNYDPKADGDALLSGGRFTMKVNGADVKYDSGVIGGEKDDTDPTDPWKWRWRSALKATSNPDPYDLQLYNLSNTSSPIGISSYSHFVILPFNDPDNDATNDKEYSLMIPTTGECTYSFVYGDNISTTDATVKVQDNYATATYDAEHPHATEYKVEFEPIVPEQVTYKVITNLGNVALSNVVTNEFISDYLASLPVWMATPIMMSSAYRYYSKTKEVNGVTTGDPDYETYSILNLEEGDIIYVRYDYNENTRQAVNTGRDGVNGPYLVDLSGKQPYLLSNYARFWQDTNLTESGERTIAIVDNDNEGMNINAPLSTRPLWLLQGNDPYEITLVNKHFDPENKKLYAKLPTSDNGKEPLKVLTATEATSQNYTHSTFMLLPCNFYQSNNGDSHEDKGHPSLVVTGQENMVVSRPNSSSDKMYIYRRTDGQKYRATYTEKVQDGRVPGHLRFEFVPMVEYHIITNEGNEAMRAWSAYSRSNSGQTNGRRKVTSDNTVKLPKFAQSPLLNEADFRYFTTKPTWNADTQTLTEVSEVIGENEEVISTNVVKADTVFNALHSFPTYTGDIYVRYTYDRNTSPLKVRTLDAYLNDDDNGEEGLDLSGGTWYNFANMYRGTNIVDGSSKANSGGFLYAANNSNDSQFGFTARLDANTASSGFKSMSAKNMLWRLTGDDPYAIRVYNVYKGTKKLLTVKPSSYEKWAETPGEGEYQTFMYLNAKGYDERGGQVAGYPYWHVLTATGYPVKNAKLLILRTGIGNAQTAYSFIPKEQGFPSLNNNMMYTGSEGLADYYAAFFRANVARRYRYHAMNCATGTPVEAWTATLEHDWLKPIVLEDAIARRYAHYEQKHIGATESVSAETWKTREELETLENAQFYSNAAMTERVVYEDNSTVPSTTYYDYYPEIEEEKVCDIWFKYVPMTNEQITTEYPNDLFRFSTPAEVSADVATHKADGQLTNAQANWFFMVLDTDADMSASGTGDSRTFTGKQYFLRREDDGTVNWMNNSYTLHPLKEDNYKNYTCHRLAEWYRKGDNDAFREGRWLWTFIGDDPYKLKVLNLESAVGVSSSYAGVYTLTAADNCYTTLTTNVDEKTGKITSYPVAIPTQEPAATDHYMWGICNGYGAERTMRLQSSDYTTETELGEVNDLLYWQMASSGVEGKAYVNKDKDRTQAVQLIKYEPQHYQDVNLVIKREDHVKHYKETWKPTHSTATEDQKKAQLMTYDSGISLLYFTADKRAYCAGDEIDMRSMESLPVNVRRAFCDYTLYIDDYDTPGSEEDPTYTVKEGPYPYKAQQATTTGTWEQQSDNTWKYVPGSGTLINDDDGRPVYPYINSDGTPAYGGAQSLYVKYKVTSDMFLKTAPTKEQVKDMYDKNDHVYFMDFPDTDARGNDNTHHAFYDTDATFMIQTGDLEQKKDKNTGLWKTEKKKWNGSQFVDDTTTPYNSCHFRTVNDRMLSVPEHLKWYFVGDPYKVQVFNTNAAWNTEPMTDPNDKTKTWIAGSKAANLARFSTVETNFQFVVDCVHMRMPEYTNIDNRPILYPTDELGNPLDPIPNRNVGKPYYNDFYWEVVPAASSEEGTFALRFKEDNDLLGYRNVYYYLAHDGLTKRYVTQGESDKVNYHINLSYNADNETHQSGAYKGYHAANDKNTVIRLVQPVKVYISAYKDGTTSGIKKTKDELSEYYGLDEMLDGMPRHLQRRYVRYDAMQRELTIANAFSKAECTVTAPTEPVHPASYEKIDPLTKEVVPTYKNIEFKYDVGYYMNDLTSEGVHIFSTCADPANPQASELQWLDVKISNGSWFYYDKTLTNGATPPVENHTERVSNYRRAMSETKTGWNNDADGWNDGLKGLHWAFIGDPYDFTIINRRRFEDGTLGTDNMWISQTSDQIDMQSSAIHFAARMWKTGGESDFILASADDVYTEDAGTEDAAYKHTLKRVVAQNISTDYQFKLIDFDLTNRRIYTDNKKNLTYNNYVNNGYCYDPALKGLGGMEQRLEVRTAVAKDNDKADNDCFDTNLRIYNSTGTLRIEKTNMEIKYDEVGDALPYSLRRYGCTYDNCYLVTLNDDGSQKDSVKVTDFDSTTKLTSTDANVNGKTFREFIATKQHVSKYRISYVYHVEDSVSQYFTKPTDALTEDYTWMNTYFAWDQYYSGTNVEVEYYERVFDHYVYNAQGQIVDEVYIKVRKTKVDPNPKTPYPTTAYLNSHTNQTTIYADEGTQSESDRQKWSLVGDPYEFTMKNYAQYLNNAQAGLTMSGSTVSSSNIPSEAQEYAILVDKNGKSYLALIDNNGEATTSITFDFSTTSDKHLRTQGTGSNKTDPTGNTLDVSGVKPFKLANLIRYADILQYHLVIAHQHSLDPTETYLQNLSTADATVVDALTEDEATRAKYTADRYTLRNHLVEYLNYYEIRKNLKGTSNTYLKSSTTWKTDDNTVKNIKTLLRENGTLRDFISYPIADHSVSRVGIGNHPQVPWYMKRQFCRYFLYQRDVKRSEVDKNNPALEEADAEWIAAGKLTVKIDGVLYKVDPNYTYTVDKEVDGTTYKVVQRTFEEDGETKRAYGIKWVSVFDQSSWDKWEDADETASKSDPVLADRKVWVETENKYMKAPKYYKQALALNGKVLDKLQDCHYNRMVLIDVVYEVIPEEFRFAYRGRNTAAWYQMMTNDPKDGLMNFSYKNGIGTRMNRKEHYTNDYMWAPEGDPYGFVLRSRYATINGSGWDNMAVTTKGHLPKSKTDAAETDYSAAEIDAGNISKFQANYTDQTQFDDKRIIHKLKGVDGATSDGPSNAVYEMFTGDIGFGNSFLMHPTSAYLNNEDSQFESYFMVHDKTSGKTLLKKTSGRSLQTDADANWRLTVTAEQLWPYFEKAGYVGGLDPAKAASNFTYQDYYNQLKTAMQSGTQLDFTTLRDIQDIVYAGTFYENDGTTEVAELSARPAAAKLPMQFKATNLVNMTDGYYRIRGFSQQKLSDAEGNAEGNTGVKGPRYVSGYRFASEVTHAKPLRFFETVQDSATIHTFADLTAKKGFSDATPGAAVLQGNIELLPVDYDASSIFRFTGDKTNGVVRYTLSSQGVNVQVADGATKMSDTGTKLRLEDVGGAAVTLRSLSTEPAGDWDTEVVNTIKTNYLTSNGDSYSIGVGTDNEMFQTATTDIQDTKWCLQPVGIHEEWPYNELPLRVEVQKGGIDRTGAEDNYYYGSMYVPFDTRLGNTTDAAFTLTGNVTTDMDGTLTDPGHVTMASVSQLNNMGNPLFVPAAWPVVLRTKNSTNHIVMKNQPVGEAKATTYADRHYVNLYIPNVTPTVIPNTISGEEPAIKLSGQYLEKTLTASDLGVDDASKRIIMAFGLPFSPVATHDSPDATHDGNHEYDTSKQVGFFTNDNWARENYPTYKPHSSSSVSGEVATHAQRNNKYVYHNKIYYVFAKDYVAPTDPSSPVKYSIAVFDEEEEPREDEPIDESVGKKRVPWPCDVYDVQGRRVAKHETPQTLLKNNPSLPKGVYIFGGRKVVVK